MGEVFMAWVLIDRPKTVKVTKTLAKQYVEMESCPHDRPLSERRLQVYNKLLNAGQFRPVTWASAYCTETGGTYRVNGKHTSIMLSGLEKMPDFFVTIEEYRCDTIEDVAKLYATFDSNMMSRTAKDIYQSFAATMPELKMLSGKIISLSATGIAYHKFGQDIYGKTQPAERAELMLDYPEFVLWLGEILSGGDGSGSSQTVSKKKHAHLQRQAVVAAMFASWMKAKQDATTFWTAVRDETGEKPTLPDRKLAKFLCTTGQYATGVGRKVKTAGTREMYCKCLHGWNAWRKGESTNLNYYEDAKVPAVV